MQEIFLSRPPLISRNYEVGGEQAGERFGAAVAACDLDGDKRDGPSLFPHGRKFRRITEGKKKDLGIDKNFILKHLKYADAVARDFLHIQRLLRRKG